MNLRSAHIMNTVTDIYNSSLKAFQSAEHLGKGYPSEEGASMLHESARYRQKVIFRIRDELEATLRDLFSHKEFLQFLDKRGRLEIKEERIEASKKAVQHSLSKLEGPDPFHCYIKGNEQVVLLNQTYTTTLCVINFEGTKCELPPKSYTVNCFLTKPAAGKCIVDPTPSCFEHEISYKLTEADSIQALCITVNDCHIQGSPFSVAIRPPAEDPWQFWGISECGKPYGLACSGRSEVIVSRSLEHCVSIYSVVGDFIKNIGCYGFRGSNYGQFDRPLGVAVDHQRNILVTDSGNHRIQKFTRQGVFLAAAGSQGSGHLQFESPSSIAFNRKNRKVYVLDRNNRVQILNSDLTFAGIFGKYRQFYDPQGIACDSTGKVYVADSGNHRIQVFTAGGKFLNEISILSGYGGVRTPYPISIAVDCKDYVYIRERGVISVFSPEGTCTKSWDLTTDTDYSLNSSGLAVNPLGLVYFSDLDCVRAIHVSRHFILAILTLFYLFAKLLSFCLFGFHIVIILLCILIHHCFK